jgi:hypothetical protein
VHARPYRVGVIDERLGQELHQLFHYFFFNSDFTVGDNCAPLLTQ